MFDTQKFGGYLARLRKRADMTQSEVADRLNLTRQAVSKYETGDSFPDISILTDIAAVFGVTVESLIAAGTPSDGESKVLTNLAKGMESEAESMEDVKNLAPLLRPSELERISAKLKTQGIDMTDVVELSRYLSDESTAALIRSASFDSIEGEEEMDFISHILPLLDEKSRTALFGRVIEGELDWHVLKILAPHTLYLLSQAEAAYLDNAIPKEAMDWYWHAYSDEVERMIQARKEP
ncbi:MAG: helix-turn-helix domain-containing protein [Clostridiales bacterium]|nr:helix-turn-helix transcriptional regulator [Clostridia bacterium]MBR5367409.1 helix-turn-helix transcriptional regulator [Clostridia bacterium]MCR5682510.1 helix-turn-helix domain-containing protein [Clostridiales bacterium]